MIKMNIVCTTDDNYVQHCAVMLVSLFEHNLGFENNIYILTKGLTKDNKQKLDMLSSSYSASVHYCIIDTSLVKRFPWKETDHLSLETYYRLFMPQLLPRDIDKVLYLDCDLIIKKSLFDLWNTDISNYALAGVDEMGCYAPDVFSRLNIPVSCGYFNAGVLLINLKYWRESNLTKQCISYIEKSFNRIVAHDQDVLNALLFDKWLHLSCEWNMEDAFYHKSSNISSAHRILITPYLKNPSILHYSGSSKPWQISCKHPLKSEYYTYLKLTAWCDFVPKEHFVRKLKNMIRACLVWLGIKKIVTSNDYFLG